MVSGTLVVIDSRRRFRVGNADIFALLQEEHLLETRRLHRKAVKKSARAGTGALVGCEAVFDPEREGQQQRRRVEGVVAVWKRRTFSRGGRKEVREENDEANAVDGVDGEDVLGVGMKVWLLALLI